MFKGPDQDIEAIYTAPSSAVCGASLQANGKEYLITGGSSPHARSSPPRQLSLPTSQPSCPTAGKLKTDGTLHVTLCDFIEPWESTSATQKKSLTQRYEMGCECKVKRRSRCWFGMPGAACLY